MYKKIYKGGKNMKVKLMMQLENENRLADNLISASEKKPKKVYFFMGSFKETGYEILENCLIDLKAKKLFVIGIDKKNTTKKMLEGLYKYTKNIFVYNNNDVVELDSNIVIFEHEKEAIVYSLSGNCSKGGLEDNIALYTKIEFNLESKEDKVQYNEYIDELIKITKMDILRKLDKEYISELLDNKEIFSNKQYTHNIMSIADLAKEAKGRQKVESEINRDKVKNNDNVEMIDANIDAPKEKIYDEDAKLTIGNMLDLEDMSFDIDVGETISKEFKAFQEDDYVKEEVKIKKDLKEKKKPIKKEKKDKEVVESNFKIEEDIDFDPNSILDLENILFEKSSVKLDTRKVERKEQKERIAKRAEQQADQEDQKASGNKKIDLNKVSNIVMEISKKPSKGKDVISIKIPNYIKEMVPNFFEAMEDSVAVNKKDGLYKEASISVEIVDTVKNKKYTDVSAVLSNKIGQTYIAFVSDMMKNVDYEEGDIVRLIKLSKEIYHIEIISKNSQEYKVWKKMCTQKFRGADREYGVM